MRLLKWRAKKPVPAPFKVGDLVTTTYRPDDAKVVRRVTRVEGDADCASTWRVWADGGDPCPCCNRAYRPVTGFEDGGIDSGWFDPVNR